MIEFRFALDETIYAEEIAAIRRLAGGKSLSKTMPKIIVQWHMSRNSQEIVTSEAKIGENESENSLANSLSSLNFE